jgi:hypothetical protein
MPDRFIAIVGSATEGREYTPQIQDAQEAHQIAEKLGAALALAGYGLMVYSAEPEYIERDVVRGFVNSGKANAKSILVLFPSGQRRAAAFPEREEREEVFDVRQENTAGWEMAFYR